MNSSGLVLCPPEDALSNLHSFTSLLHRPLALPLPPSHDHPLIGSSLPCQYQLFTSTSCSRKLLPYESCQFIEIHELFKIEQQESDPELKHITCCTRHCPCSCPPYIPPSPPLYTTSAPPYIPLPLTLLNWPRQYGTVHAHAL